VIGYTKRADDLVDDLVAHYRRKRRPEAILNLNQALATAESEIQADPGTGFSAPRPYPTVIVHGWLWRHVGGYWIAWRRRPALLITAVFWDQADIPRRLRRR
jgi:plasmid stabilization system protein ParE